MDFELENHFDNFVARKRRKPRRRRNVSVRDRVRSKLEVTPNDSMGEIEQGLRRMKSKKRKANKKVLNTLKSAQFFANRNNHPKIYQQVRKMAIDIDKLTGKLIEERTKPKCQCGGRKVSRKAKQYKNFSGGGNANNMWEKYKVPLLIGGALAFFLYSPMGKKLIKK